MTMNNGPSGFYERIYTAEISRCDLNGKVKPSALLEALQDTANEHCKHLGVDRSALSDMGLLWVIFRIDVQIGRYPKLGEKLVVQTFTKGSRLHFYPRYYRILNEEGEAIVRGGAIWMLMDKASRCTITPEKSGIKLPDAANCDIPVKLSMSAKKIEGEKIIRDYYPAYSDIDVNGHVNNTRYADWLCDMMGLELLQHKEIASISICYDHEIKPHTKLINSLTVENDEFQLVGSDDAKTFYSIYGTLRRSEI